MTLRERNLIIEQLQELETILITSETHVSSPYAYSKLYHALEIMKRQPLSSQGLPVSAGGDPEEPRYCNGCGKPVLSGHPTCGSIACDTWG